MRIKKFFRSGQGVIESVFSVGVLGLLLGGAIVLIVMGISSRKTSFDRKKATELAAMVTEELISESRNDPEEFWQFSNVTNQSKSAFGGYTYSIGFSNISANATYPNCGIGKTDCAEVVIGIGWSGKTAQTLYFNRFFSKND